MSGLVSTRPSGLGFKQLFLLLLVFLVFFSLPFFPALFSDHRYYGLESDRQAPSFSLSDHAGKPVSLSDFRGDYIFLMFGYLNCDGLCHNQVMLFQEINALLSASSTAMPVFLYISMDPQRDDAEKIAKYFDSHADNFVSLNAPDFRQVQAVAMDYRAFFSKTGNKSSQSYEIDHPGHIFLIDPKGNLRLTYSASHKRADRMVSDLITTIERQNI